MRLAFALKAKLPILLITSLCVCSGANAQETGARVSESTDDAYVYVRQRISTDYQKTQRGLSEALRVSSQKNVIVRAGDTISGIVSRQYGVGPSNAPQAFSLLQSKILAINGLSSDLDLKPNAAFSVPDVPRIALSKPNPSNRNNSIAKLSVPGDILEPLSTRITDLTSQPRRQLLDAGRKGAREVVAIYRMTRSEALALTKENPNQFETVNDLIQVDLAQAASSATTSPSAAPILSEQDAAMLRSKLSRPAVKKPVLLIFDDAWPDDTAFRVSRDFFVEAIKVVRSRYRLGGTSLSASLLNSTTPGVAGSPGASSHASQIKRALMPMEALQPAQERVTVVYLPLFRGDAMTAELLIQLVEIDLDVKHMAEALGIDAVPDDILRANKRIAANIVGAVSQDASAGILKTDEALVAALMTFLRLYSEETKRPYVLNMSWTTPNLTFHLDVPEDAYGLAVVAAGNEGDNQGTTVYQSRRQFAYRSLTPPGDMLAVMNVRDDGSADCNSSLLATDRELLGFAFNGRISSSECGTSFAAPRVAWLIAARESVTAQPTDVAEWRSHLYKKLVGIRNTNAEGFNKIRLDLNQLFDDVPNPSGG